MKKAILASGLVAVTTLGTWAHAGATPGNYVMNTGLCVASGQIDRAADPKDPLGGPRGPSVRDLMGRGPDRDAPARFTSSRMCLSPHAEF